MPKHILKGYISEYFLTREKFFRSQFSGHKFIIIFFKMR